MSPANAVKFWPQSDQLSQLRTELDELPSNDQHVVNAVNHLLVYAFDQRASDIHIEPKRESCLVRLRIDGVLHTVYKLPKSVHSAIISRIKTMSRLDISEKRKPQDGRIGLKIKGRDVDVRASILPGNHGESMVLRLLDTAAGQLKLSQLAMNDQVLEAYKRFLHSPHGIILVTGPTGSGKTTFFLDYARRTGAKLVITVKAAKGQDVVPTILSVEDAAGTELLEPDKVKTKRKSAVVKLPAIPMPTEFT